MKRARGAGRSLYLGKDHDELGEELYEEGEGCWYTQGPVPGEGSLVPLCHNLVGSQGQGQGLQGHHHHARQHAHVTCQLSPQTILHNITILL